MQSNASFRRILKAFSTPVLPRFKNFARQQKGQFLLFSPLSVLLATLNPKQPMSTTYANRLFLIGVNCF